MALELSSEELNKRLFAYLAGMDDRDRADELIERVESDPELMQAMLVAMREAISITLSARDDDADLYANKRDSSLSAMAGEGREVAELRVAVARMAIDMWDTADRKRAGWADVDARLTAYLSAVQAE
jgi:hypothetical protein